MPPPLQRHTYVNIRAIIFKCDSPYAFLFFIFPSHMKNGRSLSVYQ